MRCGEIGKKINLLKLKADYLKKLRIITNECLSNGAYSSHNIEIQTDILDKLRVPGWEKDIITKAWSVKKKFAHNLFKELDVLLDEMEALYAK